MRAADQSFLASGMPSFSAYPFLPDGHPDRRPWTGGSANAWWWHTEHDTLDKADVSILATDVKVGLEAVWGLATGVVLPLDYRATVRELQDAAHWIPGARRGRGFRAAARGHAPRWPTRWSDSKPSGQTAASGHDADALESRGDAPRTHSQPVMYTRGGRFHHDPAEWSPILRATKRFTLPGLQPGGGPCRARPVPEQRFLKAQLTRELNRARTAVREAIRELVDNSRYAFAGAGASIPAHRFIVLSSSRPHAFR